MKNTYSQGIKNNSIVITSYTLFHPITAYIFGYLAYHLVPPFFSDQGHNWFIIFLDFITILCFGIGVVDGIIFKRIFGGKFFKAKAYREDFNLLLLIFVCLVYSLRIYHYHLVGIYAFLHPYASKCTIFTTMKGILVEPFILLLWYGVVVLKKRCCYYLLFLEFLLILPIMSRSSIFTFFLYGMVVYIFFKGLSRKKLKQFAIISIILISFVALTGQAIHAARSLVYVHRLDSLSDVKFDISMNKAKKFLINRMNIHKNYRLIKGYEDYIANLDLESLKSILPKLLGFEKQYKVRPTSVNYTIGRKIGFHGTKTATAFPRSIILFHMGGILVVALFAVIFGAVFGLLFDIFYLDGNLMFPVFYFPLAWGFLMGGSGGLIGATAFQLLFVLSTYFVPLAIFYILKMIRKIHIVDSTS